MTFSGRTFSLYITFLLFSGCAGMFEGRTFIDEMDYQSEDLFIPGEDFSYTSGDSGRPYRSREEVMQRTPASERESSDRKESSSILKELAMKEKKLRPGDRELYEEMKAELETASEKIYFIGLNYQDKLAYMDSRSFEAKSARQASRGIASLKPVYRSALNLGMSKDDVISKWGRPAKVEVAGNPDNENERWTFYEGGSLRQVYFESGAVQGWDIP